MDIDIILTESFERWMKTLEYAPSTVYGSVRFVNDFFFYLKTVEHISPRQIQPETITRYFGHLNGRSKKNGPGGLSQNYITGNINAIKRYSRYLEQSGKPSFEVSVKTKQDKQAPKTLITPDEIHALYKACDNSMLGIRDRAILGVYYGCGLRRSEGISLDVKDVLLREKLILVRAGKGYRERYVPMTETVREDLENYILVAREKIQSFKQTRNDALFLSMRVKRMCGNAIIDRIQHLTKVTKIGKAVGLHSLRHSIATHLLQGGLTLEEVSRFLGHSSLESTQIYTHLANE